MPRPLPLFTKALTDSWRSTLAWALGLTGAIMLYLPLYPSIGGSAQMQQMIDALPQGMTKALNYDQIATGPGYTQATLFGLIGFLLMSMASIGWGAAAVGGDEESGLLELTLAHSVTRVQVVLERASAILVRIALLTALVFVLVLVLNGPAKLEIDVGHLFGAVLLFAALALLSGTAALCAGALTGRKVYGVAAGAAVAVLGYVFNAVGRQSPDVEWLLNLSPYHWAYGNSPVTNGADWGAVTGLLCISAALIALGTLALQRRDVGV
ncbi:ABC transporter permease subunit [Paenarthrobacter nicotinovorans]|uniref:ABC transporter permease subunit n=1 Tax=Paenarthrobacter nicotinovorans TaxID=29320 RepID=UPI001667703E|nr:ABC transporter permease subunit [Paenarthrobacter nicotinovorans]MBP2395674.1 ABC-2 type transport system permease protein [Paenarthrobacter nicotinovorans]UKE98211.1 ABC transporter permease [Paenarthrobacter nicotinovorans]UKF02998.1 ABC transporter permease [Paenarthrobacter nicotinovorans]GGV22777.1 ABC transporter permease [Paenarthrobacter nicotinovorans]